MKIKTCIRCKSPWDGEACACGHYRGRKRPHWEINKTDAAKLAKARVNARYRRVRGKA